MLKSSMIIGNTIQFEFNLDSDALKTLELN